MSQSVYQTYHTDCRHCSVCNIQSNCNKRTIFNHTVQLSSVQSILLWAVSSSASAQTVHRLTAALASGFWRHWIQSLTKLYTRTGPEISDGLAAESYFETGNVATIVLWNVCALETTDAAVGLRCFHRIVRRMTTAWIEQIAWGEITIRQFICTIGWPWWTFESCSKGGRFITSCKYLGIFERIRIIYDFLQIKKRSYLHWGMVLPTGCS
jgi:hypothetical protein